MSSVSIPAQSADVLHPEGSFRHLPPNRSGHRDRCYMNLVLHGGFSNTSGRAKMGGRFEAASAEWFEASFAMYHNSGSGTMMAGFSRPQSGRVMKSFTAFVVVQCGAEPGFAFSEPEEHRL